MERVSKRQEPRERDEGRDGGRTQDILAHAAQDAPLEVLAEHVGKLGVDDAPDDAAVLLLLGPLEELVRDAAANVRVGAADGRAPREVELAACEVALDARVALHVRGRAPHGVAVLEPGGRSRGAVLCDERREPLLVVVDDRVDGRVGRRGRGARVCCRHGWTGLVRRRESVTEGAGRGG